MVMKQTKGPWIPIELLNGWRQVEHFPPPRYRRVGSALEIECHAEPSDDAFPMFQLGEEFRDFYDAPDRWIDRGDKTLRVSIDHEGYVYAQVQP